MPADPRAGMPGFGCIVYGPPQRPTGKFPTPASLSEKRCTKLHDSARFQGVGVTPDSADLGTRNGEESLRDRQAATRCGVVREARRQ